MMLESNDYNGRFTRKRQAPGTRENSQRNLPLHQRVVNLSQEFVSGPTRDGGNMQIMEPIIIESQSNINIGD